MPSPLSTVAGRWHATLGTGPQARGLGPEIAQRYQDVSASAVLDGAPNAESA
ncbi:MAG TPA: hypothetical protein VJ789_15720 [Burkholderiales bacterium]|nr:hypothetical protein [Burkholderiales bacterium]